MQRIWEELVLECDELGAVDWQWQAADGRLGKARTVAGIRAGLQPGQLPSASGTAQANPALDADDNAGAVSQDRVKINPRAVAAGGAKSRTTTDEATEDVTLTKF
jgi:hypothetical protein